MNELGLKRFLTRARRELRLPRVSILLTIDREIRALNQTYRKKDKATDVLSFPALPETQEEFAGDIAISVEYAARSARKFGLTLQDELKILILHGLIHLSGHDHESDNGEMARLESRLRQKLSLAAGLIARTEGQHIRISKLARSGERRSTIPKGHSKPTGRQQGKVR